MDARYWIEKLNLSPHPEGGYFRETYRSAETARQDHLPARYGGARSFSTAIYFLLEGRRTSALHHLKSDEVWHFYAGSPVILSLIAPDGSLSVIRLGGDPERGESFQAVIPAGHWFGAEVEDASSYALVGCTVAPGFDFSDFELGRKEGLLAQFPQHEAIIRKLTKRQAIPKEESLMEHISLNGTWRLTYFPEGSQPVICPADLESVQAETIPAEVPGNVELDLTRAGKLPDPFQGNHIFRLRPFEFYEWWYRRAFPTPPLEGRRTVLVFHGLDCIATIWLNGEPVGQAENMLVEHGFDITHLLRSEGENELAVHIRSAVNEARKHHYHPAESSLPVNWESLPVRKAPHMYGWDICPRAVSAGLWRSVELRLQPATRLTDLYYHTQGIGEKDAWLGVQWQFETDAPALDGFALRFTGECGSSRFETTLPARFVAGSDTLYIPNARPWWPKGYGDPDLYTVTCELLKDGQPVDSRIDRIGVRKLELIRTETAGDEGQFLFKVNGTPILVKGANWVPADAFHSRDAGRYRPVLDLFDDLACNMLRCWGGNVYEDHTFFDLCDEKGILVWQDFALACSRYPQDGHFHAVMREEAESVVRKLRNHASLAVWCGNNEIDDVYLGAGMDPAHDLISRQVLPEVAHRWDPYRSYVPSSPYHSPEKVRRGDGRLLTEQHLWGPRDYFKSRFYTESTAHFVGEIGYHGCPNISSMKKFLSPEALWPWQDNEEWRTHCTDPVPGGSGFAYRVSLMANQTQELFGSVPETLEDFVLASQVSQAEAKKFFVEMVRLKKWRRTGLLWWNVCDCWPQFSDAIVDYYLGKKLAYYYLRRVQQPVCVMVDEPEDWHVRVAVGNDSRQNASGHFRITDTDTGQALLEGNYAVTANENRNLGRIRVSRGEQKLFVIEWTANGANYGNHYLLGTPPFSLERYRQWLRRIASLPMGFEAQEVGK
ncbi:MAG: cupin domain-containing protein [Armatimonadetes bacterium]|nr:cupin domain-containing protein [Armatimonadota bacterium]